MCTLQQLKFTGKDNESSEDSMRKSYVLCSIGGPLMKTTMAIVVFTNKRSQAKVYTVYFGISSV